MWMLDYRREIESDFSVFHRVDDIDELSSSRFVEFAELLPSYQGAVRLAMEITKATKATNPYEQLASVTQIGVKRPTIDAELLSELAPTRAGFPGVGYRKG